MKLLRAIQEGEVEPVGARQPVKVDVRLVSATNRNLIADVKTGRFREDLFYRLHVFPISVPPLRARAEDIPDLTRHFLARFAAEEGKRIRAVSADALTLLANHRWPGNVRQLENAVFRAVVLAEGDIVGVDEFPQVAAQAAGPSVTTVPDVDAAGDRRSAAIRRHWRRPRHPVDRPAPRRALWACSTPTAKFARWRKSKPTPSASPSPIIAGRCPRSRAG